FDFFMAQSSQRFEPPQNTGRFSFSHSLGILYRCKVPTKPAGRLTQFYVSIKPTRRKCELISNDCNLGIAVVHAKTLIDRFVVGSC
ncbi:hypothetical protein, partial [Polaromonas eurypsychrophila]